MESHLQEEINIPLQRFTAQNICDTIKQWVVNDVDYNKYLIETEKIMEKCQDYTDSKGDDEWMYDMKNFVTEDTLNIIMNYYVKWRNRDSAEVQSTSIKQIAHILYNYPLNELIAYIESEQITGDKIIDILKEEKNCMIKMVTGWTDRYIEQIELVLLKYRTFSKKQIIHNHKINTNFIKNPLISIAIMKKIKETIFNDEFDIEMIHHTEITPDRWTR
eukprot:186116_1